MQKYVNKKLTIDYMYINISIVTLIELQSVITLYKYTISLILKVFLTNMITLSFLFIVLRVHLSSDFHIKQN